MQPIKTDADDIELKIHAERVKTALGQATTAALTVWFSAVLVSLIPNDSIDRNRLLIWFYTITLCCVIRLVIAVAFRRQTLELHEYRFWGWLYAVAFFLTAVTLSSSLFVLVTPDNPVHQLVVMSVLIGLGVGVSQLSTSYLLLGHLYNIPVMSAYVVKCFLTGGATFYIVAALGTFFSIMMYVVCRDTAKRFTENLKLRFELAQKRDEAESANLAKTKFLAATSHDIRQPLHALTMFTELVKDSVSEPKALATMKNIDESIEGLKGIFDYLLDFSKLDAGTINIQKEHFPATKILRKIENEYRHEAQAKGLSFSAEPCEETIYTDPILLGRILSNLAANAIRYTKKGSIVIRNYKQGGELAIEITDTGIGIPKEHQEEIFKEFVQLANPERDRTKGLGLGLSIVSGLVDLLGIDLQMDSNEGTGTTFFLKIPLGDGEPLESENTGAAFSISQLTLDGLRVVLIDDEPNIREATYELLQSWHCDARTFSSCREALDGITKKNFIPQVILADYRLADNLTGLQAIDEINALLGTSIQAAIVTGDTAPDRLKEAEASGHVLMHKPVQPMQLRNYLTKIKIRLPD